jgi:hypothetical protein
MIPYENVLHGHSHLALLGWTFFGVFILFLVTNWRNLKNKKQAIIICFLLFIISLLMFSAFLWQSYGGISIAFSAMHIFVEYWAAFFIYKHLKNVANKIAALFIKGSLVALIISSLGPYAIAIISANGLKGQPIYDMAIYFYLHFQYNGWLTLVLIGLFISILQTKNIVFQWQKLKISFWFYFISLFPGYFLSTLWANELGNIDAILATIGSIGQWIGVIYIIFAFRPSVHGIKAHFSKWTNFTLAITFILLFLKSTMELGLIYPDLASLVYETRSVIIGYLHLTLLGFISIFIFVQYLMVGILKPQRFTVIGLIILLIGFTINELFLFLQTLLNWFNLATIPYYLEGLLVASILLAAGVLLLWLSFCTRDYQISLHNERRGTYE